MHNKKMNQQINKRRVLSLFMALNFICNTVGAETLTSQSVLTAPAAKSTTTSNSSKVKTKKKHKVSNKVKKERAKLPKGPHILLHPPLSPKKVKTSTSSKATRIASKPIVIPPPARPARIKKGSKKVVLFKPSINLPKDPTDLQLCVARVFQEPLAPMHTTPVPEENAALAKALLAYRSKTNLDDVSDLTGFLSAFPKSRWRPAVELNLGTRRFETGYLTDAMNYWTSAWESAKGETEARAKSVADEALGHLSILQARLGRKKELDACLSKLNRRLSSSAQTRVRSAQDGLACMKKRPDIAYKCGPFAVDSLLAAKTGKAVRSPMIFKAQSTDQGTNFAQLDDWAKKLGLDYQLAKRSKGAPLIAPSIMHWKLGHFATIIRKEKDGRYRIKDPTFDVGGNIAITSAAIDAETDGYFLVPKGRLPKGWQAVSKTEAQSVWGKGYAFSRDPEGPCQPKTDMSSGDAGPCGLARASAYSMQTAPNIQDIPLSYTPPIGPKMDFLASYDYLASNTISNDTFPNFGANKYWTFNWVSYLTISGSSNITVNTRGGGSEYYPYPYGFNLYSQAQLVDLGGGVYQRQLPDGSIEVFNQADGTGRIFMTEVIDPQGNSATIQYDMDFRITSITDAIGQQTTLTYLSSNPLLPEYYYITQITDPFSRSCTFSYGSGGAASNDYLISITDSVGLVSKFHYNGISAQSTFIDWITTPYGTTSFCTYEPDTILPSTALQVTYPDGTTSVLLGILFTGETYFWDREAMKRYPSDSANISGVIDDSHAKKTRWCYSGGPFPVLTAAPWYVKPPLENQTTMNIPVAT